MQMKHYLDSATRIFFSALTIVFYVDYSKFNWTTDIELLFQFSL